MRLQLREQIYCFSKLDTWISICSFCSGPIVGVYSIARLIVKMLACNFPTWYYQGHARRNSRGNSWTKQLFRDRQHNKQQHSTGAQNDGHHAIPSKLFPWIVVECLLRLLMVLQLVVVSTHCWATFLLSLLLSALLPLNPPVAQQPARCFISCTKLGSLESCEPLGSQQRILSKLTCSSRQPLDLMQSIDSIQPHPPCCLH